MPSYLHNTTKHAITQFQRHKCTYTIKEKASESYEPIQERLTTVNWGWNKKTKYHTNCMGFLEIENKVQDR